MSFFFLVLPFDLQIHLFHEWICVDSDCGRQILLTLSAVDVACCNNGVARKDFLFLAKHLRLACDIGMSNKICHTFDCMEWAADRQVQLKAVHPATNKCFRAHAAYPPSIEHVLFSASDDWHIYFIEDMLKACPMLTSIACEDFHGDHWELGRNLLAFPCKKLKRLRLVNTNRILSEHIVDALRAHGPQLEALQIVSDSQISDSCLSAISQHCFNLRELEITVHNVTCNSLVSLTVHCRALVTLVLRHWNGPLADLKNIAIAAGPTIRTFKALYTEETVTCGHMTDLLTSCPHFQLLSLGTITYCRSNNMLVFDCEPEVLEGIDVLLELNLPISKLVAAKPWFIDLGGCDQLLRKVVKHYQSKLTELTLNSILYTGIIRDCMRLQPNLISFSAVDVSDALLNELGKHCRNLRTISLCNSPHVSDTGFTALFAGVFNTLKVIICSDVPLVTACTLFNILHFRVILKKFTWSGKVGFDAFDVAEFVRKARNWQLVPLPVMLCCTVKSKQRI